MIGNEGIPKGNKKPYLLIHYLDLEEANKFRTPVKWEVSELVKGELEIVYEGELDFSNPTDRWNLARLAEWCYSMGYALTTFKMRKKQDVQRIQTVFNNGRRVD